MLYKFLLDAKFHELLSHIDSNLAMEVKQKGCPHCGEKLNHSNYPRSPFGVATLFRSYYQTRESLCCIRCRKRTMPPSVRFFGRRWYCSAFLLLLSALIGKRCKKRMERIHHHLGNVISQRTWKRWRRWWNIYFPSTSFWKKMKGIFPLFSLKGPFPRIWFRIFTGSLREKMIHVLRWLAPITAGALRAV